MAERDPSQVLTPDLQALLDAVTHVIPAPLLEAQRSSWCSEERVRAIGKTAQTQLENPELDSADGDAIKRWAAVLAGGTLTTRQKLLKKNQSGPGHRLC